MNILKNKITYVYLFILFATISAIIFNIKEEDFVQKKGYIEFSDNWYSNNKEVELQEVYKYEEVSKKIPEMTEDQHIHLIVKNMFIDIYIENEKVYSYSDYNKDVYGKTPGTYFIDLNINKEDSGKEIKLKINDVYKDKSGKIIEIYFGNSNDILSKFVFNHLLGIIIPSIIIFIGFVFVILYFILRAHKVVSIRLFHLSLFAMFIGIFMLADSKCLQILSGNEYIYNMISKICMLVILLPIMQFVGRAYENVSSRKIINILSILGIINFVICFLLNTLHIYDYHETLILTKFTYAACIIYILYLCIKTLINKRKKEIYHTIGILFICGACIIDIILSHNFNIIESNFFTRIGVLIFLCFEGVQFSLDSLALYRKQERISMLQKLAYEDGLTGLLNRTSFMNDKEELKQKKSGLIAVFDVNNLKTINDTYGHTEGDELILTVANALKENFSEIGKCYRIGGDEFVFISTEKNIEKKFKSNYKILTNYLNDYNKSNNKKYKVSVAMGYCNISKDLSIDETFNLADSNMYKTKIKMKKNHKLNIR